MNVLYFTGNCYIDISRRCDGIVISVHCWYLALPLSVVTVLSFIDGYCASGCSISFLCDSSSFITAEDEIYEIQVGSYTKNKIKFCKNKDRNILGNNTYEAPAHRKKDFPDGSVKRHPLITTLKALQTSSYGSPLLTVMDSWLDLMPTNGTEMNHEVIAKFW